MPPYFFLSCAQADDGPAVQRFFRDLSDSIRVREKLPDTEIVGCSGLEQNSEMRDEGLKTSCMMLALVSANYLRDRAAERDWHAFELRQAQITRINWSRNPGPLPKVVSETRTLPQPLNDLPLGVMIGSIGEYKAQYAEFVNGLADFIIASTASFQLPELDSIPDEVPHVFEQEVVEPLKETASRQTTQSAEAASEKYLVFAIDDAAEDMQQIQITARFSRQFDVKAYTDSNQLLNQVVDLIKDRQEPDLIVVNPALTLPGTHRFRLIDALLEKKVPSAILAVSTDPDAERSLKSAGINDLVATLPKPFAPVVLLQRMRHWAKIGRDKRYRRGRSDERPVFLSFCTHDEAMASKLCKWLELREIGVWYSLQTITVGDPWIERIAQGLMSAEVFIALISNQYPKSKFCPSELGVVLDRLQRAPKEIRVMPVRYNSPTDALEDPQVKMCLDHHAVEVSDREWLPGFQAILDGVQNFLKRR